MSDLNFCTPSTATIASEPPPVVEPQRSARTVTDLPSLVVMVKPILAKSVNSLPDGPLRVSISEYSTSGSTLAMFSTVTPGGGGSVEEARAQG